MTGTFAATLTETDGHSNQKITGFQRQAQACQLATLYSSKSFVSKTATKTKSEVGIRIRLYKKHCAKIVGTSFLNIPRVNTESGSNPPCQGRSPKRFLSRGTTAFHTARKRRSQILLFRQRRIGRPIARSGNNPNPDGAARLEVIQSRRNPRQHYSRSPASRFDNDRSGPGQLGVSVIPHLLLWGSRLSGRHRSHKVALGLLFSCRPGPILLPL